MGDPLAGSALRRTLLLLVVAGVGAGLASPASARRQIDERGGPLEQAEEDARLARSYGELVQLRLYTGSDFTIGSDFDEFTATSYEPGGRMKLTLPVADNAAIRVIARGSALLTDFHDVSTTLFGTPSLGDPYGDLYATSLQLQGGVRPGWSGLFSDEERWTLVAEGRASARWERGARFGQSITGGGAVGVGYQIADWLEVLAGAGVSTRLLDQKLTVHPVVEIEWHFAERWSLRSRGLGGQLEFDIDEGLTVFAAARQQGRSFLVAERSGLGGEGMLRESSLPVSLGLRWDVGDHVEVTLIGGVMLKHTLRGHDDDRDEVGHVRAGPAPFLGLTFELRPDGRPPRVDARAPQRESGAGSSSTSISTSR